MMPRFKLNETLIFKVVTVKVLDNPGAKIIVICTPLAYLKTLACRRLIQFYCRNKIYI